MAILADFRGGVAFPPDQIRSAIEAAAFSRFTGTQQISIGLRPEAANLVVIEVDWKHSHMENKPSDVRVQIADPTLKKPVASVIEAISPRLFIRTMATALELKFLNGVLQPHWTHHE